jgi:membrane protease YdiL (CAAX protease family)
MEYNNAANPVNIGLEEKSNYDTLVNFFGKNIDESVIKDIAEKIITRRYNSGEFLVREGEPGEEMFIIRDGSAEVSVKKDGVVNLLSQNDYFGELALFSNEPRKASVKALEPMDVFIINSEIFGQLIAKFPAITKLFMDRLYMRQKKDFILINKKNEMLEESIHMRKITATFFSMALLILCFYTFGLFFAEQLFMNESGENVHQAYIITRIVEITALVFLLAIGKKMGFSLQDFGLTLKNAKRSFVESSLITTGILVIMLAGKFCLVYFGHTFLGETVFSGTHYFLRYDFYTYIPVAFLQEFIARGIFQSTLHRLTDGKNAALKSIFLCSVIFGVLHLHISLMLSLVSIIFSFIWGFMYVRHKNIIGVSFSHFLIGNIGSLLGA